MHIVLDSDPTKKGLRSVIILMSLDPDWLFTVAQRRGHGNQPWGYIHLASAYFEVLTQFLYQLCARRFFYLAVGTLLLS